MGVRCDAGVRGGGFVLLRSFLSVGGVVVVVVVVITVIAVVVVVVVIVVVVVVWSCFFFHLSLVHPSFVHPVSGIQHPSCLQFVLVSLLYYLFCLGVSTLRFFNFA